MDTMKFTDEDISALLKNMLETTGNLVVDDSPDKFIRAVNADGSEGEIRYIPVGEDRKCPVAIYGTHSNEAVIMNPFAEGAATSARESWWYNTCNCLIAVNVANLMKYLIKVAVTASKSAKSKKKKEEDTAVDLDALKLLGSAASDIDEKTIKEFDSIVSTLPNFMGIRYDKSTKTASLKCLILIEAQRKAHTTVRVKTWTALTTILNNIFGTDKLSETFSYKATIQSIPIFESYLAVYIQALKQLKDKLTIIDVKVKNLGALESSMNYLPQYHSRAKWCVSVTPSAAQTTAKTPWRAPTTPPAERPSALATYTAATPPKIRPVTSRARESFNARPVTMVRANDGYYGGGRPRLATGRRYV